MILFSKTEEKSTFLIKISELEVENERLMESNKKLKKEYLKVCELNTRTSLKLERVTQTNHINGEDRVK